MRPIARLLLVGLLALAALAPPRLHAMALSHAADGLHRALSSGSEPCHTAPQAPIHADRAAKICLTACACLPAVEALAGPTRWVTAGERLGPAPVSTILYDEPEVPLRPPCAAV